MPRPAIDGDELQKLAVPPDQKVRRNPHTLQIGKIGMRRVVKAIGEQGNNLVATKNAWRQGDVVYHDQLGEHTGWPLIAVRRGHAARHRQPPTLKSPMLCRLVHRCILPQPR